MHAMEQHARGTAGKRFRVMPVLAVALCAAKMVSLLLGVSTAAAQEESRAGLVIVHGDGSVLTKCVDFTGASISGADLLVRSGLDLSMEAGGVGATICRLDGEGCNYPENSCFCQCEGSPCIYWSYWRLTGDAWQYSNIGAGNSIVRSGDVDGWRWGEGTVVKAEAPPGIAFEDICMADAAIPVTATVVTATPTVEATASPTPAEAPFTDTETTLTRSLPDAEAPLVLEPVTALGILVGVLLGLPLVALLIGWLRRRGQEKLS